MQGAEAEGGREIEGDGDATSGDQVGADQVEVMDHRVAGDATEQSFDGQRAQPAPVPGQKREQGADEHHQGGATDHAYAGSFHLAGTEPAHAEHPHEHRKQESGNTEHLEEEVAAESADHADPVGRWARGQRRGGGVQGRVER